MHVFTTGATGWVGSAVVGELIGAGPQVTGLARSDDKATAAGAKVVRASRGDLEALQSATSAADAVIHTAFNHDFSKFLGSVAQDQRVIETLLPQDKAIIAAQVLGILRNGAARSGVLAQ